MQISRSSNAIRPAISSRFGRWRQAALPDISGRAGSATEMTGTGRKAIPDSWRTIGLNRVGSWLDGLAPVGGHVIAVTHPAIVRAAIVHAMGAAAAMFWRIDIAPLTYTSLRRSSGEWRLRSSGSPIALVRSMRFGLK
ncbi:MAG: histidine phosphatase family protein [Hyphomicrobiales bacterium]|nr:histidine phosphatase family protein [Hyphomicrobiales bacterium]MBV9517620.1 histidine phosphatase family protein [Hyphomicrobiales bacterium]